MYKNLKYNSKSRWLSYWYQINEAISLKPERLLLIGKGSGIVENTISTLSPDIKITTLDIEPELSPHVVGDMRHMPFKNSGFNCILCCQVLEHIPFYEVRTVLKEFQRLTSSALMISIPQKRKHLKLEVDAPLIGKRTIILKYPFNRKIKKENRSAKKHFWEINRGVSLKLIKKTLEEFFIIEKTFLNEINCTHRFFILKRKKFL